jgi:RNA recognition motif-containing protein
MEKQQAVETKPNCTLYVNNLSDKATKAEQKVNLYFLFSQFGEVVDIVTKKTAQMRGQAFVVFSDIASAELAKKSLQNFNIFDKNMAGTDNVRKLASLSQSVIWSPCVTALSSSETARN